jgi:hypothetical protein
MFGKSRRDKTQPTFTGPYRVTVDRGRHVFDIQSLVDAADNKTVHAQFLKLYADSSLEVTPQLVAFAAHSTGGNVIDTIIDHRQLHGQHEFLVQWKGEDAADATWEPAVHIYSDAPSVVKRYIKFISPPGERKIWSDLIQSWA